MSKYKKREFCNRGHDVRSDESVYMYISKQGNWVRECIECIKSKNDRRADQLRANHLWRIFKRTPAWYDEKLASQNGHCAICGADQPGGNGNKSFQIDHDRKCCSGRKSCGKCIRELLCSSCNSTLGHVDDDIDLLYAMIEYIKRNRREHYTSPHINPE